MAKKYQKRLRLMERKVMMLCHNCHQETDVAYNELCYPCYRRFGRMPKAARKPQITEVVVA